MQQAVQERRDVMIGEPPHQRAPGMVLLIAASAMCACGGGAQSSGSVRAGTEAAAEAAEPLVDESRDESLLRTESVERLEPTLRAYRAGEYHEAAILLQRIIDEGPTVTVRQDAMFFLAKTRFHLGYRWAALSSFYDLAQQPDHPFRDRILAWLSLLARLLPDDGSVIESITNFESSDIDGNDPQEPTEEVHHIRYLMGRSAYRQGAFDEALDLFVRIPASSRWYLEARFFSALVHVRMHHARRALAALHDILRATRGAPPDAPARSRIIELTWMNVGRLHSSTAGYHEGALARSLAAYGQVPPGSESVPRVRFEQAWVLLRLERYDDAEAALDALPESFACGNPEVEYLRVAILFCRTDAATDAAAAAFVNTHENIPEQIEAWLAHHDEDEVLAALEALRGGVLQAPEPVRELLRSATESGGVRHRAAAVASIEQEIARLDEAPDAFRAESGWATALQDLVLALSLERFNLGRVLRDRLLERADEVRTLVAQALEIRLRLAAEQERSPGDAADGD